MTVKGKRQSLFALQRRVSKYNRSLTSAFVKRSKVRLRKLDKHEIYTKLKLLSNTTHINDIPKMEVDGGEWSQTEVRCTNVMKIDKDEYVWMKVDELKWKKMDEVEVDEVRWRWANVNEDRWKWIRLDEGEWRWMKVDEVKWRKMEIDEVTWRWLNVQEERWRWMMLTEDKIEWRKRTLNEARWMVSLGRWKKDGEGELL